MNSAATDTPASDPMQSGFYRLIAVALVALFLLAGGVLSFRSQGGITFPDEVEYHTLAENLVKHQMLTWDGVSATASRPPGYILWLAIWEFAGVGWHGMVFLNFILVASALWALTAAWFDRAVLWQSRAIVYGLLFLYPVSLYVFSTLYPQAFCLCLMAFSLALLLGGNCWGRAALAGFLMGWCVLSAPMYLTWAGLFGVVPLFKRRFAGVLSSVFFWLSVLIVLALWATRNSVVMGGFVPFSTNSGFNLLIGNNENTRPNAGLNVDVHWYVEEVKSNQLNELEADRYYSSAATEWIAKNPLRALQLYGLKALNYFNFRNELVTQSAGSVIRDAIMFVTYYALLAMVLARLLIQRRIGSLMWHDWMILLGYVACALFTSLVLARIRYRIPSDVLLFFVITPMLSACLNGLWKRVRELNPKELGASSDHHRCRVPDRAFTSVPSPPL